MFEGKGISRKHFEFHQYYNQNEKKNSWKILDTKSQTHVYVNGNVVQKNKFLPLNDKDVISIGGNYSLNEASGDKRIFLYEINAPQNCDSAKTTESESDSEGIISKHL